MDSNEFATCRAEICERCFRMYVLFADLKGSEITDEELMMRVSEMDHRAYVDNRGDPIGYFKEREEELLHIEVSLMNFVSYMIRSKDIVILNTEQYQTHLRTRRGGLLPNDRFATTTMEVTEDNRIQLERQSIVTVNVRTGERMIEFTRLYKELRYCKDIVRMLLVIASNALHCRLHEEHVNLEQQLDRIEKEMMARTSPGATAPAINITAKLQGFLDVILYFKHIVQMRASVFYEHLGITSIQELDLLDKSNLGLLKQFCKNNRGVPFRIHCCLIATLIAGRHEFMKKMCDQYS